jgi:hypothetical protein
MGHIAATLFRRMQKPQTSSAMHGMGSVSTFITQKKSFSSIVTRIGAPKYAGGLMRQRHVRAPLLHSRVVSYSHHWIVFWLHSDGSLISHGIMYRHQR